MGGGWGSYTRTSTNFIPVRSRWSPGHRISITIGAIKPTSSGPVANKQLINVVVERGAGRGRSVGGGHGARSVSMRDQQSGGGEGAGGGGGKLERTSFAYSVSIIICR